jgi:hypothetical protein
MVGKYKPRKTKQNNNNNESLLSYREKNKL